GGGAWRARALQRRRRRAGAGVGRAPRTGKGHRRQAAAPLPALGGVAARRRGNDGDDDRGEGSFEREGGARARLGASRSELAAGVPGGPRADRDRGRTRAEGGMNEAASARYAPMSRRYRRFHIPGG